VNCSIGIALALTLVLLAGSAAFGHGIEFGITGGEAQVIQLKYHGGGAMVDLAYELYAPGDETPYQTGRSDKLGRIVFVPGRDGEWRLKAWTEDGHGVNRTFLIADPHEEPGTRPDGRGSGDVRGPRVVIAIAVILLLGAGWYYLKRRGEQG